MTEDNRKRPEESCPVGKTPQAQERNAVLLSGYDYKKYPEGITGYTGQDLQRIIFTSYQDAIRTRVGPRGNYKGAICRLADGSLLVAVCRRVNNQGLFQIHFYASVDKGLNWTEIGETKVYGKEMSLTAVPDGSLVLTTESKMVARDPTTMHTYRSTDGGRTWQTHIIDGMETSRNVVVETNGSLLMVRALRSAYWKHIYDMQGKPYIPSSNLELLRSNDGGQSWIRSEGKIDWDNPKFGEVSAARLANGDLLASLRSNPPGTEHEGTQVTYLTRSTDDGETWCKPRVMTNRAEVQVNLLLLHNGRLLATYTNYHLPFGVCAIVSEDNGETWGNDAPILLAISADNFTGWPVTVELEGGELITSYAITAYLNQPPAPIGAERNVCETVRWRLPE